MAAGYKTGGRDIQKGQVLNPLGRGAVSKEERERRKEIKRKAASDEKLLGQEANKMIKKMSRQFMETYFIKYMNSSVSELMAIVKDSKEGGDATAMEMMIVRIILEGIKRGDTKHLDFILDRTIGKVKDHIEVSGNAYDSLVEVIKDRREKGDL